MKPGDRIRIIRSAARSLANQEWDDIKLTLRQFGFDGSDEWIGTKQTYLLEHLQDGSDQALSGLADFLTAPADADDALPTPQIEVYGAEPWKTGGYRLFLSHVTTERENIGKLAAALANHGIEAFVAHDAIDFGAEWEGAAAIQRPK